MCILCVPLFRFLGSNALIHAMARCGPRRHGSEPSAMEWQREPGHATESRHFAAYCDMKIHENTWSTDEAHGRQKADHCMAIRADFEEQTFASKDLLCENNFVQAAACIARNYAGTQQILYARVRLERVFLCLLGKSTQTETFLYFSCLLHGFAKD